MSRLATALFFTVWAILSLAPTASADDQKYYYCEYRNEFNGTDYYSSVFQAPEDDNVYPELSKYAGPFFDYIKAHYSITTAKNGASCLGEKERGAAKQDRDKALQDSNRRQRKVIDTGWSY